jgi:small conductance mechanosensitive channel
VSELWQKIEPEALAYAGRVLGVLFILAVGYVAVQYLVAPLRRLLDRGQVEPALASFVTNTVRTLLLVAVLLAVLQQLGVQTTSLVALLGAAGLAVALSLQSSLANFAAGLLLLAFRIVRIGDQVEVGDVRGRVSELLPFHVVIETPDQQRVTLPNTLLTGGPVRNHSALPRRRAQWALPVPARADLPAVKGALRARLLADRRVLQDPAPELFVQDWAEDRRVLAVQAWVATADYPAVQQELLEQLGAALTDAVGTPPREGAPRTGEAGA